MLFCIAEYQIDLCQNILQIMQYKSRHAIKCGKLSIFRYFLARFIVEYVTGYLSGNRSQIISDLPVQPGCGGLTVLATPDPTTPCRDKLE